jgi:hypothetical protein
MGLTDLDFYQATAAAGPPARGEQTRETRARTASPHQDTKAISNHNLALIRITSVDRLRA